MAEADKRPSLGVSQGRGWREDRGARQAAVGSSEVRFTGQVPGV